MWSLFWYSNDGGVADSTGDAQGPELDQEQYLFDRASMVRKVLMGRNVMNVLSVMKNPPSNSHETYNRAEIRATPCPC